MQRTSQNPLEQDTCGIAHASKSGDLIFSARSCKTKMCENYETVKQELDRLIVPSLTARKNIGLAVGVIKHGQHQIFGYGTLSDTRMDLIDGSTLFEIGSVTKVFTSVLLVSATEDDLVGLDDRLCNAARDWNSSERSPCASLQHIPQACLDCHPT